MRFFTLNSWGNAYINIVADQVYPFMEMVFPGDMAVASCRKVMCPVTWFKNDLCNTRRHLNRCHLILQISIQTSICDMWEISTIYEHPTLLLTRLQGSTADGFVPDSTTYLQRSSEVHALMSLCCFCGKRGIYSNIRWLTIMLWLICVCVAIHHDINEKKASLLHTSGTD